MAKTNLEKLGAAQAVLLSAMLGLLALALVHFGMEWSLGLKTAIRSLTDAVLPGAQAVGPYAGKETIALLVWLGSWIFLHLILKDEEWDQGLVLILFLLGIGLATTLLWPPFTEWLIDLLKGLRA